jgi:hypothetical protein
MANLREEPLESNSRREVKFYQITGPNIQKDDDNNYG